MPGLGHDQRTVSIPYPLLMASLCLVDLALSGVYMVISGHLELLPRALLSSLLVLGAVNALVAARIFRPIKDGCVSGASPQAREAAARRLTDLPGRSALWAALLSVVYCTAVFVSGTFTPDARAVSEVPLTTRLLALGWFVAVYSTYYAFYIYFLVGDHVAYLRERVFAAHGIAIHPQRGGFRRKLTVALVVVALVPNLHLILDLTVFQPLRAAQGLDLFETVFLDLFATLVVLSLALIFITRTLGRPVAGLAAAVERTAAGTLDALAPVTSDDELGVLSAQFNRMIEGLRERAFIRETFGKYVPESIVAAIVDGGAPLKPKLATATILFADIADFTAKCEQMEPVQIVSMLNEYYEAVVEPIERHGGVVNQFQGDAILVTFNVPVADPEHARHAVAAARGLLDAVERRTFAGMSLRTRVGINTGEVVAGNVGSAGRYNYTVHGDAVNVAARLEQMNRTLGTRLLVSESTVALLEDDHPFHPLGELPMRGKHDAVLVYGLQETAVTCAPGSASPGRT